MSVEPLRKTGRPRVAVVRAQTREFLRRVAAGESTSVAKSGAGLSPARLVRLLDDDAFFAAYQAVRRGEVGPVAALVYLHELRDAA